jgi:hypothetical protein
MTSVSIRTTKLGQNAQAPPQSPNELSGQTPHAQPVSPCEPLHVLIATRVYELYRERGCRGGSALDDWLEAEGEVLSQITPV